MGQRKVEIKRIQDKNCRQVAFCKRRKVLLKKAKELSILCDVDVAVLIISHRGRLHEYSSNNRSYGQAHVGFTKLDLRSGYWQVRIAESDEPITNCALNDVKDLRSFLGLANYYRKFIPCYSNEEASLKALLKNNVQWFWSEKCDGEFPSLKETIATEPIMKLPHFEMSFEVHTDASDKAVEVFRCKKVIE
ncbi:protein MADS AFFECTING FLOWERING 5-like [Solanum dulcamara]|uniref:protein MADS AFFECTING FLOWERING 5-like n=1 Tax=Solanum dulcamara TaxID=45834 RepID=UPI002485D144|nr:protein MADS AFFECTING FLOWERING 5-like [Solanum dulcamara]